MVKFFDRQIQSVLFKQFVTGIDSMWTGNTLKWTTNDDLKKVLAKEFICPRLSKLLPAVRRTSFVFLLVDAIAFDYLFE